MTRCESHVNTRLRYVLKSEGNSGFPIKVEMSQVLVKRYEYVINVSTDLNAPNGAYITKRKVSGVV